jgi:hypothetical protein
VLFGRAPHPTRAASSTLDSEKCDDKSNGCKYQPHNEIGEPLVFAGVMSERRNDDYKSEAHYRADIHRVQLPPLICPTEQ